MSVREIGWSVFLAGLPFTHLLFRPLDIWHGQAVWAQGGTLLLFALSIGSVGVPPRPNRAFAALLSWVGVSSLWLWVTTMQQHKFYPVPMLQSLMHFVLILFFYLAATTTWTVAFVERLARYLAWVGLLILGYCLLQSLNLDQFFHDLDPKNSKDQFVGVMGNPSHLAIHLTLFLFLFLLQEGWVWRVAVGGCLIALVRANSTGGYLAAYAGLVWWTLLRKPKAFIVMGLVGLVGVLWVLTHPALLNPFGRYAAWGKFWEIFSAQPITGYGPGFVSELSRQITDLTSPIFQWRHVHNEYFQMAIEFGVIGLALLGWMIKDLTQTVWKLPKTPLVVTLSAMLVAFGVNSLVNFPAHLWATGSLALMAYCGLHVIAREVGV